MVTSQDINWCKPTSIQGYQRKDSVDGGGPNGTDSLVCALTIVFCEVLYLIDPEDIKKLLNDLRIINSKLEIISVGHVFAEAIKHVTDGTSLSSMFS